MKSITIEGTERVSPSIQELKKLRADGKVPCVIYGGGKNIHFHAPALSFRNLVYTPLVHTVKLNIDGTEHETIMKEIQFHPVTDRILHIDFLRIFPDQEAVIDVPVKVTGSAEGVKQGGKLITKVRKLKIKALPANIPDDITVNVDSLLIGQSIRVGDIKVKGVTLLDKPNNTIVGVRVTREVVEEVAPVAATTAAAAPAAGAPAAPGAAPSKGAEPAPKAKSDKK